MGWNRLICPDCGHEINADKALAALEAEYREQEEKYGGMPSFRRPSVTGTFDPIKCPECGLRVRAAFWPALFIVIPLWLASCIGLFGMAISQKIDFPPDLVELVVKFGLGIFIAGFIAMIWGYSVAKPIRCGHY
ncbi:hypothetical protein [Maricaulis parjimensis]|uniref:hypothetical protein n=1 Tax=Maricaulis parjimensis TaxID=144023 RepID=UPI00193A1388|nr:hypothetical protein [Maricaulis parjimensis]